jgi:hypothetical protein
MTAEAFSRPFSSPLWYCLNGEWKRLFAVVDKRVLQLWNSCDDKIAVRTLASPDLPVHVVYSVQEANRSEI